MIIAIVNDDFINDDFKRTSDISPFREDCPMKIIKGYFS